MAPQSLPAIALDLSVDGEFTITATNRLTGEILAAAMGYWIEDVTLKIDLQLIELGVNVYAPEDFN